MSLRIISYEQTFVARRTLGHYLKLLGPNFLYCFLVFEKNNFFRSHEPECSKYSLKRHMSQVKIGFVG